MGSGFKSRGVHHKIPDQKHNSVGGLFMPSRAVHYPCTICFGVQTPRMVQRAQLGRVGLVIDGIPADALREG